MDERRDLVLARRLAKAVRAELILKGVKDWSERPSSKYLRVSWMKVSGGAVWRMLLWRRARPGALGVWLLGE